MRALQRQAGRQSRSRPQRLERTDGWSTSCDRLLLRILICNGQKSARVSARPNRYATTRDKQAADGWALRDQGTRDPQDVDRMSVAFYRRFLARVMSK